MRLKNISKIDAFRAIIKQCDGDVYLKSNEGDVFNLKSSFSEYIAISKLLAAEWENMEIFATLRQDETKIAKFLANSEL